jgi:soluble lytic murein transglycosylase-like protein
MKSNKLQYLAAVAILSAATLAHSQDAVITVAAIEPTLTTELAQRLTITTDCFDAAAAYHQVNPWVLRAISKHESGGKAHAIGQNTNGSQDWGAMQINTQHLGTLAKYGIGKEQIFDGCVNVFIGAWVLKGMQRVHGNTWTAIGAYNTSIPARRVWYAGKIQAILDGWRKKGLPVDGQAAAK